MLPHLNDLTSKPYARLEFSNQYKILYRCLNSSATDILVNSYDNMEIWTLKMLFMKIWETW